MREEIAQNKTYLILEKTTSDTPDALRRIGRAKLGADFVEYAGCPKFVHNYDDIKMEGYYDTGFDESSVEFRGKDSAFVKTKLAGRKKLKSHFETLVKASGNTEQEFLDEFRLKLSHNEIVDTSDMTKYLQLYFAMRGNRITPDGEEGNEIVYGKSMYKLVDKKEKEDTKAKYAKMAYEVKHWMHQNLANKDKRKGVLNVLTYINWMKPLTTSEDYIITEMVEEKIKSVDALERIYRAMTTVEEKELVLTADIATWVQKGIIKRQKNSFFYNDLKLGETMKEIYLFLINDKDILNELNSKE